jgi:hypothetical protein
MESAERAQILALVGYLGGDVPVHLIGVTEKVTHYAPIIEGWPGGESDQPNPCVVVSLPSPGAADRRSAAFLKNGITVKPPGTPQTPGITALYSVGTLVNNLQIDVFASSRAERSDICRAVSLYMGGEPLEGSGHLTLATSDYYHQPIGYDVETPFYHPDDPSRIAGGEWRATAVVKTETEEIIARDLYRILRLDLYTTILLTFDVPGIVYTPEQRTLFQPPA